MEYRGVYSGRTPLLYEPSDLRASVALSFARFAKHVCCDDLFAGRSHNKWLNKTCV